MESEEKNPIVPAKATPPYRRPKDQWADQEPYDPYDHEALANEPV